MLYEPFGHTWKRIMCITLYCLVNMAYGIFLSCAVPYPELKIFICPCHVKTPHWFFCNMDTNVGKNKHYGWCKSDTLLDPTLPIWLNLAMPMFMVCSVIMSLDSIRLWVRFQKNLRKYCLPLARVHFSFVIHENIVHHLPKSILKCAVIGET